MNAFMYVKETPWHNLGYKAEKPPARSDEIIINGKMDWEVASIPCETKLHDKVGNYNVIYRTDNNAILGVVNKFNPQIIQNRDTFVAFEQFFGNGLEFETAASAYGGRLTFGCFKLTGQYKVMDDDIRHYLVIVNDHLKPDGKVAVMNTPIRVACENALSSALTSSLMSARVPLSDIEAINVDMAQRVMDKCSDAIFCLQDNAERMYKEKLDNSAMTLFFDEMFPMVKVEGETVFNKTNENMELARREFQEQCMDADNLDNYRGTFYQLYNAVVDWSQHYYRNASNGYDLNYRLKTIPGFASDGPATMVTKLMKMRKSLVA